MNELIFDVAQDEPLSEIDDSQTACEVVPSDVTLGNSIPTSAIVQAVRPASKDFKDNKPTPTEAVVSVQQDNGGSNEQHEEMALPVSPKDTELKEAMLENRK
uniref:Uncharacterized protein n=1 Tax=Anopheles culicifacies TaxID=139723 RepID=A0A182LYR3_9DIPT